MKTCFKCNIKKPLTEFYKHNGMVDGYLNKCKECAKLDANNHRSNNLEKIREYDRIRGKNKERIKANYEISSQWRKEDKRRTQCHNKVSRAIKKGELVRLPCEKCGEIKSYAHHEDYDKPLDVMWLCQPCHKKRHIEINNLLRS